MFKLGLIINPIAGIGGPLGLKGSDGELVAAVARSEGAQSKSPQRTAVALQRLTALKDQFKVFCYGGDMGADVANSLGLQVEVIGYSADQSSAQDTMLAASALKSKSVDLLLFAGGDGTARDIFSAVGSTLPVLGIPAGVKMHSGVFAVSPTAAGAIVELMLRGQLVEISLAEVRDIDEEAFRKGIVRARYFGELMVPREGGFLQQVKSSGREVEALSLQDIAADVVESLEENCLYIIGPGTTTRSIMEDLGLENTLLGVDAILNNELIAVDLNEKSIMQLLESHDGSAKIIITAIGGQGHIIGRGNQQISAAVIRKIGVDNLVIVATKTKITELNGRPLLVDSGDLQLDELLSGYRVVITGYHDAIIYPVGQTTLNKQSGDNIGV